MKKYEDLTLKDDFLFAKVMSQPDLCKQLLELMLDIKIDHLEKIEREHSIDPHFDTHGIRLDVYVKDSDKIYDIELQTTNEHNLEKRARYYQSVIDTDEFEKNLDYKELKETYIIFICTFDPFGDGQLKYDIKQFYESKKNNSEIKIYNDNTHKIFYNLSSEEIGKEKSELINFFRYILDNKVVGKFTSRVAKAVNHAKHYGQWRKEYMNMLTKLTDVYRDGLAKGIAQGVIEGERRGEEKGRTEGINIGLNKGQIQATHNIAKAFLKSGFDINAISKCTGLSVEELKNLENE